MIRTKKRMGLCIALMVLILAFIWGNSAMPGDASGNLSDWVGAILSAISPFLATEQGLHFLRKAAHFSEFAALGMTLSWLFAMISQGLTKQFGLPLLCGAVAACIDETIQIFTPGRYSSIVDVCIDCSGVLTGILIFGIFLLIIFKIRRKKAAIS